MRLVMIFMLLFSSYLTLISSRPSLLREENDSEIGGEYENDESVDDEYVPEQREPAVDEVPQEIVNGDSVIQDSEELIQDTRLNSNKHIDNSREGSEKFTESEMNIRKDTNKNNAYDLSYRDERFSFVKDHPNYKFGTNSAAETEGSKSSRTDYHQKNGVECRNADEKSKQLSFDKSQDMLFKRFNDHVKEDKFDYINGNERSNLKKQYDNNKSLENKPACNYDYLYFSDRNRRQVQSLEEKPVTVINRIKNKNTNLDVVNENTILKNIKKLSEQDLEDLMNSLPEDKKALLKKIMDKREITKKDGAIEDSSYLDQSDVSNIEGTFLVNTNPVSSLASNSDTTEANKHIESGGSLNTKVSDTENESGKSGSKSKEINDTSTTEELSEATDAASKEESNNKESLKSENKREINQQYFTNENIPLDNSVDFDSKNSNDFPINEESSENEDWFEHKNEELIAEQREVSQGDPSDLSAPVEKLEDSFPNVNKYRETESEMEPLIRIKRKEIQHKITKRDHPFLENDNISFITNFDSEGSENKVRNEFNYKASLHSQPNYLKDGVQGVDQNFMNNKQLRKKRALSSGESLKKNKNSVNKTVKFNGTSRTISHKANNSKSENLIDASKYRVDDAFGSFPLNSEEDLNRYKRIKRVKNVSN